MQELKQQLQLLVNGHNDLVNAYNQNWHSFGASIKHLDSRVGGIVLMLDDLIRGGVDNVSKLGPLDLGLHEAAEHPALGGVHWPGYIKMYVNKVEAELAALKEKHASEAPQVVPFDPLITPEGEESPEDADVVFGGKDNDGEASTGLENRATG